MANCKGGSGFDLQSCDLQLGGSRWRPRDEVATGTVGRYFFFDFGWAVVNREKNPDPRAPAAVVPVAVW